MERLKKDLQIEKEKHRRLALAEAGVCACVSVVDLEIFEGGFHVES